MKEQVIFLLSPPGRADISLCPGGKSSLSQRRGR